MEAHKDILRIGFDMQYVCVYTFGDRCIHLYVVQHTHVPGQLSGSVWPAVRQCLHFTNYRQNV